VLTIFVSNNHTAIAPRASNKPFSRTGGITGARNSDTPPNTQPELITILQGSASGGGFSRLACSSTACSSPFSCPPRFPFLFLVSTRDQCGCNCSCCTYRSRDDDSTSRGEGNGAGIHGALPFGCNLRRIICLATGPGRLSPVSMMISRMLHRIVTR
jgi:hypothetical protein